MLWETLFARSTELAGGHVMFATCGGRLPICDAANTHSAPPMPCNSCSEYAEGALRAAGYTALKVRDLVDLAAETRLARERIADIRSVSACEAFTDMDLPIGRLVRISVAWFLARGSLPDTPAVIETYRGFLVSGQVLARAFAALLDRTRPDRVFTLNGTFFAERIMLELCRRREVGFTTYERGFIADTVVVTPGRPAAYLEVPEAAWAEAAATPLTEAEEHQLDEYLGQRSRGERTLDNYWQRRLEEWTEVCAELRLDPARPIVTLFSNIAWDSAVQERDIAFESLAEMVVRSIEGFADRPDHQLVVRLHPAEIQLGNHPTLERMGALIEAAVKRVPENVRVIPSESAVSSYTLMSHSALGLVHSSTVGLEMAVEGIPVVVTGKAHFRGRGFTFDVDSEAGYWRAIDTLLSDQVSHLDPDQRALARRYAHLFFFRFMQAIPQVVEAGRGRPRMRLDGGTSIAETPELVRIAGAIVAGTPVVASAGASALDVRPGHVLGE